MTDKILIKKLKSYNEEEIRYSFNCVYNKYFKLVCFCISQYISSKEDVEEIANDTFISLFNNINKLEENKNLKYYLLTIAKNNAISFLRKYSKYSSLSDELINLIPYEEDFHSNDLIEQLKEVLSKDELMILIEHLIYGYSFKEISIKNNVSINTITSKYRRTLTKAKNKLSEEYELWTRKKNSF